MLLVHGKQEEGFQKYFSREAHLGSSVCNTSQIKEHTSLFKSNV